MNGTVILFGQKNINYMVSPVNKQNISYEFMQRVKV